ncbi:hypothetical protein GJ496_009250 [Pomphorhynchus laevis]|nr:hypothetical protein GJ496_009250 [Pomphorhynchus laevis]
MRKTGVDVYTKSVYTKGVYTKSVHTRSVYTKVVYTKSVYTRSVYTKAILAPDVRNVDYHVLLSCLKVLKEIYSILNQKNACNEIQSFNNQTKVNVLNLNSIFQAIEVSFCSSFHKNANMVQTAIECLKSVLIASKYLDAHPMSWILNSSQLYSITSVFDRHHSFWSVNDFRIISKKIIEENWNDIVPILNERLLDKVFAAAISRIYSSSKNGIRSELIQCASILVDLGCSIENVDLLQIAELITGIYDDLLTCSWVDFASTIARKLESGDLCRNLLRRLFDFAFKTAPNLSTQSKSINALTLCIPILYRYHAEIFNEILIESTILKCDFDSVNCALIGFWTSIDFAMINKTVSQVFKLQNMIISRLLLYMDKSSRICMHVKEGLSRFIHHLYVNSSVTSFGHNACKSFTIERDISNAIGSNHVKRLQQNYFFECLIQLVCSDCRKVMAFAVMISETLDLISELSLSRPILLILIDCSRHSDAFTSVTNQITVLKCISKLSQQVRLCDIYSYHLDSLASALFHCMSMLRLFISKDSKVRAKNLPSPLNSFPNLLYQTFHVKVKASYRSHVQPIRFLLDVLAQCSMIAFDIPEWKATSLILCAARAYDQFVQRQMRPVEKVDAYLADLTRIFGIITTVHNEDFLKCAFVKGLPASVKSQLIASSNFSDMQLCDIVVKARSMLESQLDDQSQLYYTKSIRTVSNDRDKNIQCFTYHKTDCNGLVDIGATRKLISKRIYLPTIGECTVTPFDGSKVTCKETVEVDIQVQGGAVIKTSCLFVDMNIPFDALVGMDIINRLGGIQISRGSEKFLGMRVSFIIDDDFSAIFDRKSWSCEWVWKNGEPEKLYNSIAYYSIDPDLQQDFEKEVNCWIREGWLIPYDGEVRALVPLMAVMQASKSKVRPALNFRELNGFVTSNTADADACVHKIRKIKILTDSSSVRACVACAIMRDKPISTRGLVQALVRIRVSLLHQILEEYEIDATIEKIESAQNKADVLSRIPKAWMNSTTSLENNEHSIFQIFFKHLLQCIGSLWVHLLNHFSKDQFLQCMDELFDLLNAVFPVNSTEVVLLIEKIFVITHCKQIQQIQLISTNNKLTYKDSTLDVIESLCEEFNRKMASHNKDTGLFVLKEKASTISYGDNRIFTEKAMRIMEPLITRSVKNFYNSKYDVCFSNAALRLIYQLSLYDVDVKNLYPHFSIGNLISKELLGLSEGHEIFDNERIKCLVQFIFLSTFHLPASHCIPAYRLSQYLPTITQSLHLHNVSANEIFLFILTEILKVPCDSFDSSIMEFLLSSFNTIMQCPSETLNACGYILPVANHLQFDFDRYTKQLEISLINAVSSMEFQKDSILSVLSLVTQLLSYMGNNINYHLWTSAMISILKIEQPTTESYMSFLISFFALSLFTNADEELLTKIVNDLNLEDITTDWICSQIVRFICTCRDTELQLLTLVTISRLECRSEIMPLFQSQNLSELNIGYQSLILFASRSLPIFPENISINPSLLVLKYNILIKYSNCGKDTIRRHISDNLKSEQISKYEILANFPVDFVNNDSTPEVNASVSDAYYHKQIEDRILSAADTEKTLIGILRKIANFGPKYTGCVAAFVGSNNSLHDCLEILPVSVSTFLWKLRSSDPFLLDLCRRRFEEMSIFDQIKFLQWDRTSLNLNDTIDQCLLYLREDDFLGQKCKVLVDFLSLQVPSSSSTPRLFNSKRYGNFELLIRLQRHRLLPKQLSRLLYWLVRSSDLLSMNNRLCNLNTNCIPPSFDSKLQFYFELSKLITRSDKDVYEYIRSILSYGYNLSEFTDIWFSLLNLYTSSEQSIPRTYWIFQTLISIVCMRALLPHGGDVLNSHFEERLPVTTGLLDVLYRQNSNCYLRISGPVISPEDYPSADIVSHTQLLLQIENELFATTNGQLHYCALKNMLAYDQYNSNDIDVLELNLHSQGRFPCSSEFACNLRSFICDRLTEQHPLYSSDRKKSLYDNFLPIFNNAVENYSLILQECISLVLKGLVTDLGHFRKICISLLSTKKNKSLIITNSFLSLLYVLLNVDNRHAASQSFSERSRLLDELHLCIPHVSPRVQVLIVCLIINLTGKMQRVECLDPPLKRIVFSLLPENDRNDKLNQNDLPHVQVAALCPDKFSKSILWLLTADQPLPHTILCELLTCQIENQHAKDISLSLDKPLLQAVNSFLKRKNEDVDR